MHYATIDNRIGEAKTLPEGAVEITSAQYREAIQRKASRERVTVVGGEMTFYAPPVYSPDGTKRDERDPGEPLITTPPTEGLHIPVWDGAQWIEDETQEQQQERETQELESAKEQARIRIKNGFATETGGAIAPYPETEIESWPQQEQEAQALLDNPSADPQTIAPLVTMIADDTDGETPTDVANNIVQKAQQFRGIIGPAIRKRRQKYAEIETAYQAGDHAALEAISWS